MQAQTAEPVNEDLIPLNPVTQTGNNADVAANSIQQPKLNISLWDYVRMILVLACVVGVIYLIFFLMKKGMKKRLPQNDVIKILSSYNLPGNSLLFLVEVGTNIFFVSSGDGKVNLISEIRDKESLDTIRLEAARASAEKKQSFSETLLKMFRTSGNLTSSSIITGKDREPEQETGSELNTENKAGENPIDFIKRQRSRLENMR